MSIVQAIKDFINPPKEEIVKTPQTLPVDEAATEISALLTSAEIPLFQDAASGNVYAKTEAINRIKELLAEELITVEGYPTDEEAADAVFIQRWGHSAIDEYLHDDDIDEITIMASGDVWVWRNGVYERTGKTINNDPHDENNEVKRIIQNITPRTDSKSVLTKTTASIRFMMADGSRVMAMGPPVTRSYAMMIRKRDRIKSVADILQSGTIDKVNWERLSLLAKGMANMIISGGVGTGKSTTLEILVGELSPAMVIRAIDLDNELRLSQLYPERNILEMEAHPEANESMDDLAKDVLGMSPQVIVVGEFRAPGEAKIAVRQGLSGHQVLSTAHFQTPVEAIYGTARMLLQDRVNMQYPEAKIEVANAFNVVVQLAHDAESGARKIDEITEVYVADNDEIFFNPLIKWQPSGDTYLGDGSWGVVGTPSPKLKHKMARHNVPEKQILELFPPVPATRSISVVQSGVAAESARGV